MSTSVMRSPVQAVPGVAKKIRDTERLLRRPALPATLRAEMERKLAFLRGAAQARAAVVRARALDAKSRALRFVEGKKAGRRVKAAAARVLAGDAAAVCAWLEAKKDALYAESFPAGQKYVALYPCAPISDERLLKKRAAIRESLFAASGLSASMTLEEAAAVIKAQPEAKSVFAHLKAKTVAAAAKGRDASDDDEDSGSYDDDDDEEGDGSNDSEDDDDEESEGSDGSGGAQDDDSNDSDDDDSEDSEEDDSEEDSDDDSDDDEDSDDDDEDSDDDDDDDEEESEEYESGDSDEYGSESESAEEPPMKQSRR